MAARKMPRTGERRKSRRPFGIDKLPSAWRDRIIEMRAKWASWDDIEQESTAWKWEELAPEQQALFPDHHIPHSNLLRWYDVQYVQKMDEVLKQQQASVALAAELGKAGFDKLGNSVRGALAGVVFAKTIRDPEVFERALLNFGHLLSENRRNDIAEMRANVEKKKLDEMHARTKLMTQRVEAVTKDCSKKLGEGHALTLDDINRLRERTFGLPPLVKEKKVRPEELHQSLDKIHGIGHANNAPNAESPASSQDAG